MDCNAAPETGFRQDCIHEWCTEELDLVRRRPTENATGNLASLHTTVETPERWDAIAIAMYLRSADGRSLSSRLDSKRDGHDAGFSSILVTCSSHGDRGNQTVMMRFGGYARTNRGAQPQLPLQVSEGTRHFVNCIEHQFGRSCMIQWVLSSAST